MPRKKDGMPFEMFPTPAKGKDGKILYYPRPRSGQKISMRGLDEYCAKHYGLRPFELTRAFDAFIQATGYWLSEGYRIDTPIGSFAPRLRVIREITDPDDVQGRDVRFDGVEYNSGKLWHESVEKWLEGFRRVQKGLTYYSAKKQLNQWTLGQQAKLLKTKRGQEYIYTEI